MHVHAPQRGEVPHTGWASDPMRTVMYSVTRSHSKICNFLILLPQEPSVVQQMLMKTSRTHPLPAADGGNTPHLFDGLQIAPHVLCFQIFALAHQTVYDDASLQHVF